MQKRDRQSAALMSNAALNIGNICRGIIASRCKKQIDIVSKSLPSQPPPPSLQQKISTISNENTTLRESLKRKEKECSDFSIRMSKLSQSYMDIEQRLIASNRELLILQADQITPPAITHKTPMHIPVNTQGKDAIYWHQACRTIQRQYTEIKTELVNKTDQFIRLNESYRALFKRLEEVESKHDEGTPQPKDRPHASDGSGSSAPLRV